MSEKPYYVIIDFEATCWGNNNRQTDQEVIEFGCVKMAKEDRSILDEFVTFVRPTRFPKLSTYCTKLTSIRQEDVDNAPDFPNALAEFVAWLGDPSQYSFCSWGTLDLFLLRYSCRAHNVPYPFDDEYIDIKPAFTDIVALGRATSMQQALEMLEIPHTGRLHRGIDDARSIAKIWQQMQKGISPLRAYILASR